jgi:hypothetical protein
MSLTNQPHFSRWVFALCFLSFMHPMLAQQSADDKSQSDNGAADISSQGEGGAGAEGGGYGTPGMGGMGGMYGGGDMDLMYYRAGTFPLQFAIIEEPSDNGNPKLNQMTASRVTKFHYLLGSLKPVVGPMGGYGVGDYGGGGYGGEYGGGYGGGPGGGMPGASGPGASGEGGSSGYGDGSGGDMYAIAQVQGINLYAYIFDNQKDNGRGHIEVVTNVPLVGDRVEAAEQGAAGAPGMGMAPGMSDNMADMYSGAGGMYGGRGGVPRRRPARQAHLYPHSEPDSRTRTQCNGTRTRTRIGPLLIE